MSREQKPQPALQSNGGWRVWKPIRESRTAQRRPPSRLFSLPPPTISELLHTHRMYLALLPILLHNRLLKLGWFSMIFVSGSSLRWNTWRSEDYLGEISPMVALQDSPCPRKRILVWVSMAVPTLTSAPAIYWLHEQNVLKLNLKWNLLICWSQTIAGLIHLHQSAQPVGGLKNLTFENNIWKAMFMHKLNRLSATK